MPPQADDVLSGQELLLGRGRKPRQGSTIARVSIPGTGAKTSGGFARGTRRLVALASALAAAGLLVTAGAASARVPQGFVGMMADGPIFGPGVNLSRQLDKMVASGVESLRVAFSWSAAQPYASWADVPASLAGQFTSGVGGVPTDFSATDRVVGLAARRGLSVLPVAMYAPPWDLETNPPRWDVNPINWPIQPHLYAPFANYLTALIGRYGPHGSFWQQNPDIPRMPIRRWQVWNEPNLAYFWSSEPFADTYVVLLRAAHDAIKAADPGAQVVLAGLANNSWDALDSIYQVRGAKPLFDAVAIHPYTAQAAGVLKILRLVRNVMNRYGDSHKPLLVTELGWPSSLGHASQTFGLATTPKGQAQRLADVIPMLAAARRQLGITGFDVYTWLGDEAPGSTAFNYSGLFAFSPSSDSIRAKPAYAAFRKAALAVEGCRVKASLASRCQRGG
jgi:hypothetical protein